MQTTHPGQAALSTESTEPTQPAEERERPVPASACCVLILIHKIL